jgi:GST-like protein
MIDYYGAPTTNCWKVAIALEEMGLDYAFTPVNMRAGEQKKPEYLAINPNGKVPAIVDHNPNEGSEPLALFDSNAILLYLADKTKSFFPSAVASRAEATAWLMWQASELGPIVGNSFAFSSELHPLGGPPEGDRACEHFATASRTIHAFLNERLSDHEYICDEYSIVDMASWSLVLPYRLHALEDLSDFPHVQRWLDAIRSREAVQRGMAVGRELTEGMPNEFRKALFGE